MTDDEMNQLQVVSDKQLSPWIVFIIVFAIIIVLMIFIYNHYSGAFSSTGLIGSNVTGFAVAGNGAWLYIFGAIAIASAATLSTLPPEKEKHPIVWGLLAGLLLLLMYGLTIASLANGSSNGGIVWLILFTLFSITWGGYGLYEYSKQPNKSKSVLVFVGLHLLSLIPIWFGTTQIILALRSKTA
jgi:hypothetical protein